MNPQMEDRSVLFNEINSFSHRKLKKVETKVVTGLGENVIEKRGAKGLQAIPVSSSDAASSAADGVKLDLQVGLVVPGILIASQDVASHKDTLEEYGVTHIVNLAADEVPNSFEDDYNYLSIQIEESGYTNLSDHFDQVFDLIDEGKQRGNVLVHCNATKPGLSRSTAILIAYLMTKEGKRFEEAFNDVKEARSFVRPSDHFIKQLTALDVQLAGAKKESDIYEDPFTRKKREEIEKEKEMLKGGVKLKDRVKLFADQTTPSNSAPTSRVNSPLPNSLGGRGSPAGRPKSQMNGTVQL